MDSNKLFEFGYSYILKKIKFNIGKNRDNVLDINFSEDSKKIHQFNFNPENKSEYFNILKEHNGYIIPKGKLTIITGPSGHGKTTLLSILGFLNNAFTNSNEIDITCNFASLKETAYKNIAADKKLRRQAILKNYGFMFQNPYLLYRISSKDNVKIPLYLRGAASVNKTAESIIKKLDIEKEMYKIPGACSGGEQQRIALARALVHYPDVILADEPTASLDVKLTAEVFERIRKNVKENNQTAVVVTHDLDDCIKYADMIICLVDGKVYYYGENINTENKSGREKLYRCLKNIIENEKMDEELEVLPLRENDVAAEPDKQLKKSREAGLDKERKSKKIDYIQNPVYNFLRRIKFYCALAFNDLLPFKYEKRCAVRPVVSSLIIALILVLAGLCLPALFHLEHFFEKLLKENPMIEVIPKISATKEYSTNTANQLSKLIFYNNKIIDINDKEYSALKEKAVYPIKNVYPFQIDRLKFYRIDNTGKRVPHITYSLGLIFSKDDFFNKRIFDFKNMKASHKEKQGIIILRKLLNTLNYKQTPEKLYISYKPVGKELGEYPIKILNTIEKFPAIIENLDITKTKISEVDYFIPEKFYNELHLGKYDPDPYFQLIKIGKFTENIKNKYEYIKKITENKFKSSAEITEIQPGEFWLEIRPLNNKKIREKIMKKNYFKIIKKILPDENVKFYSYSEKDKININENRKDNSTAVMILVLNNIKYIDYIVDYLKKQELDTDKNAVSAIKQAYRMANIGKLIIIFASIGFLLIIVFYMMQYFADSVVQKKYTLGILKAFGMSEKSIISFFTLQAFILSLLSVIFSIIFIGVFSSSIYSLITTFLISMGFTEINFYIDWSAIFLIDIVFIIVSCLVTFLTVRGYAKKFPFELLYTPII